MGFRKNVDTDTDQSNYTDEEEVRKPSKTKSVNVNINVNTNDDVSMTHSNGTDQEGALTVLSTAKDMGIDMVQDNKEIEKRTNNTINQTTRPQGRRRGGQGHNINNGNRHGNGTSVV